MIKNKKFSRYACWWAGPCKIRGVFSLVCFRPPHSHSHSLLNMEPSSQEITDVVELRHFKSQLWKIWGISASPQCPTANPVSLMRNQIPSIYSSRYVASLKADGIRYMLLLTNTEEGTPVALMINRRMKMFEISVEASKHMFDDGSLFDGELVEKKGGGGIYLVFDAMVIGGESYTDRVYLDRLGAIATTFPSPETASNQMSNYGEIVAVDNDRVLVLAHKPCIPARQVASLWDSRVNAVFHEDGIVFTPVENPIQTGTHSKMFKWKAVHTVDVLLRPRPGSHEWACFGMQGKTLKDLSVPESPQIKIDGVAYLVCISPKSKVLEGGTGDTSIVECTIDVNPKKRILTLYPILLRPDKNAPNQIYTFQATVKNVIEGVTISEIVHESQNHV